MCRQPIPVSKTGHALVDLAAVAKHRNHAGKLLVRVSVTMRMLSVATSRSPQHNLRLLRLRAHPSTGGASCFSAPARKMIHTYWSEELVVFESAENMIVAEQGGDPNALEDN